MDGRILIVRKAEESVVGPFLQKLAGGKVRVAALRGIDDDVGQRGVV
jgi:hypothetical protein